MTRALWHYTCADAAPLIARDGLLLPNPAAPLLPVPVVWATDLEPSDVPDLDLALGLRGRHTICDRLAYRFRVVDVDLFVSWSRYAREQHVEWEIRQLLESTPGGFPAHWHVSMLPARCEVDA